MKLVVPGITDPSKLAILARARTFAQYVGAVSSVIKGTCPFCLIDTTFNKVLNSGDLSVKVILRRQIRQTGTFTRTR